MNIEPLRKKLRRLKKRWFALSALSQISTSTIRRVAETDGYMPSLRTVEALTAGIKALHEL